MHEVGCHLGQGDGQGQLSQAGIRCGQVRFKEGLAGRQLIDALNQTLQARDSMFLFSDLSKDDKGSTALLPQAAI